MKRKRKSRAMRGANQKKPSVPPWFLFKMLLGLVRFLEKLRNRIAPPQLRMVELISYSFRTKAAHACAHIRLADHLGKEPRAVADLAQEMELDEDALFRLLRVARRLDIVKQTGEREFAITSLGSMLDTRRPDTLHSTMMFFGEECHGAMSQYPQCISDGSGAGAFERQYGKKFFDHMRDNDESGRHFDRAMWEFTYGAMPAILAECDFSSHRHVVDVGGGFGHVMQSLLRRYPKMRGTLFDQVHVIDKAKENEELSARCDFVGGDFFEAVPEGGDLYIMKYIIHDWPDEDALRILTNVRRAMKKGVELVLFEMVIDRREDEWTRLAGDMLMMTLLDSKERTRAEYEELLRAAGFKLVTVRPTRSFLSVIHAEAV